MYFTRSIRIDRKHELYSYCDRLTALSNSLMNAVRFRQRQVISAVQKDESEWSDNEAFVFKEIRDSLPEMGSRFSEPGKDDFFLSYTFLEKLMRVSGNPDFADKDLPRHSAQQAIKLCVRDMKAFFAAMRKYSADKSAFTGKPELPGYRRKNGHSICVISNQEATLKNDRLKLPHIKTRLSVGKGLPGRLKEVKIVPDNGEYVITVTTESGFTPVFSAAPERIASIDFGVENIMAVTNNCGLPCLIYKGGAVKSINRLYDKSVAKLMSAQTNESENRFRPTRKYHDTVIKHNDRMNDILHKDAKHLITWCVENRIDTIVVGVNRLWKDGVSMGRKNNQEFTQIPHQKLRMFISYLAERNGIRYAEQEESYTSKASFLDNDLIPDIDAKRPIFSGHRAPKQYKGIEKETGFRGLYSSADGIIINSDLNGSANILRKAFPDAFLKNTVDFFNVVVIKHPDKMKM